MALMKVGGESTFYSLPREQETVSTPLLPSRYPRHPFSLFLSYPSHINITAAHPSSSVCRHHCLSVDNAADAADADAKDGRTDGQFYPDADIGAAGTHSWVELGRRHSTLRPVSILSTCIGHILEG